MTHPRWARYLSEVAGTALLVGIGTGAIVLGADRGGAPIGLIALAWFVAVLLPVELFAYVSGAHLNPAVTVGLIAAGRFPRAEGPPFVAAQLVGALAGSFAVREGLGSAAHLGATLPGAAGPLAIVPMEFTFTLLLAASVLYLTGLDREPTRVELVLPAAVVGLSTWLIGPYTGSSLNPARSLAPALLSGDLDWLWLYLLVTTLAALVAAAIVVRRPRRIRALSQPDFL